VSRDLVDSVASGVFVGLDKPAPTRARSRVLTDDELRILWPAMQDEAPREAAFLEFALRTGQRRGEILGATLEQSVAPHESRFTVKGGREQDTGAGGEGHAIPAAAGFVRIILASSASTP
jgi:integrase